MFVHVRRLYTWSPWSKPEYLFPDWWYQLEISNGIFNWFSKFIDSFGKSCTYILSCIRTKLAVCTDSLFPLISSPHVIPHSLLSLRTILWRLADCCGREETAKSHDSTIMKCSLDPTCDINLVCSVILWFQNGLLFPPQVTMWLLLKRRTRPSSCEFMWTGGACHLGILVCVSGCWVIIPMPPTLKLLKNRCPL